MTKGAESGSAVHLLWPPCCVTAWRWQDGMCYCMHVAHVMRYCKIPWKVQELFLLHTCFPKAQHPPTLYSSLTMLGCSDCSVQWLVEGQLDQSQCDAMEIALWWDVALALSCQMCECLYAGTLHKPLPINAMRSVWNQERILVICKLAGCIQTYATTM